MNARKKKNQRMGRKDFRTENRWDKIRKNDCNEDSFGGDAISDQNNNKGESIDDDDVSSDISAEEVSYHAKIQMSVKVYLWEFGQNDPKRDSGSKLCRLGYAEHLRIGQNFNGIVMSSEASKYMSPEDAEILLKYGIAGINCSWNRLDEIPFTQLGKARNQRKLPLIYAANTVNYGKPFKMNTAEAISAALYIAGFREDASSLMYSFSYGQEFFKINLAELGQYASCSTEKEIAFLSDQFIKRKSDQKEEKLRRKELEQTNRNANNIGGYMDDIDLPPMEDEYEYEEDEEGEEEAGQQKDDLGTSEINSDVVDVTDKLESVFIYAKDSSDS